MGIAWIRAEEKAYTEYMKKLGVPVRHLNQLGREALLDNAEMMSHHEKYSSTINISIGIDGTETITFGNQNSLTDHGNETEKEI